MMNFKESKLLLLLLKIISLIIILVCVVFLSFEPTANYDYSDKHTYELYVEDIEFYALRNRIQTRINEIDEYLESFVNYSKPDPHSRLIYPNVLRNSTKTVVNNNKCSDHFGNGLLLLVIVFTRVDNFERRKTIRNTWGNDVKTNPNSAVYFAVGLTSDLNVQNMLENEYDIHNDIIQLNFYEHYLNLTIKSLSILRWTSINCPFVKWMLKIDDDSVLISDNMIEFANSTKANSMYGMVYKKAEPFRNKKHGFFISYSDYADSIYPDFIPGQYLIPGHMCSILYEIAMTKTLPALPYEDVYITGILAQKVNIARTEMSSVILVDGHCNTKNILRADFCYYKNATIFWQYLSDNKITKIWRIYKKSALCPSSGSLRCY